MRLRAEQLDAHLSKSLAPLYTVYGDEPLLALEAADAVRAAARARGYAEREVHVAERGFDWSALAHAGASRSLFGDRKLVELRLPSGRPGTQGAEALAAFAAQVGDEVIGLVTMPRPDGAGWWKSAWFGALESRGVMVEVQPVRRAELPGWIARRLARQRQSAPPEVLEYLADRVEGHLLAAHQELQKLALLAPEGALDLEAVRAAVADVARYDADGAAEALLEGSLERYARALAGLRAEGEPPTLLVHSLGGALAAAAAIARGAPADAALRQARVWSKPLAQAVPRAAARLERGALERATLRLAAVDRAAKGVGPGEAWDLLLALGLELAHGSEG